MTNRLTNPDQELPDYIKGYIANPRETFNCELKSWINPSNNENEKVMIAKACLALRNNNGGALLIGISNDGAILNPPDNYDSESLFTQDTVQAIVSSYSAQSFGVEVHHVQLAEPPDSRVVAIDIPGKITTPAICKRDSDLERRPRVKKGIIYTRTVESNGTVSSAPASQQDLEKITKSCFDNRTADIGQFLRDHLTDKNLAVLKSTVAALETEGESDRDIQQQLEGFSASSADSFGIDIEMDGGD